MYAIRVGSSECNERPHNKKMYIKCIQLLALSLSYLASLIFSQQLFHRHKFLGFFNLIIQNCNLIERLGHRKLLRPR